MRHRFSVCLSTHPNFVNNFFLWSDLVLFTQFLWLFCLLISFRTLPFSPKFNLMPKPRQLFVNKNPQNSTWKHYLETIMWLYCQLPKFFRSYPFPSKSNCIQQKSSEFNLGALFGNAVSSSFNTMFGRDCRGRPQGDYFYGCQVKNLWKLSQFKRLGFENYISYLQCVGPFGVGRKKRSPLFLNSNQVPRDQKSLSFCFD